MGVMVCYTSIIYFLDVHSIIAELSLASCCDLRKLVGSNASSSFLYLEAETYIETFLLCFSRRMLAVQKLRVMRDFCKAGKVGLCLRQVDKSGLVST